MKSIYFYFVFIAIIGFSKLSAQVIVDVNLNMKHSVDSISDFGRDRHMTIHSNFIESDWKGEEDKLDYLINDLDVYFGRETGSATWKNQLVEEDPEKPGWPNEAQMITHSNGLKQWYESDEFSTRRPYSSKAVNMIMGVNDFSPVYPSLAWFDGFGKGKGGWFVTDVDAGAEWVALYLDHYLAKSSDSIGEPLPKYWECYNEPDMNFMNPSFGMIISSLEKNWEFHKLTAKAIRKKLGNEAPKIGGMTWGQLDLYKRDGIPNRSPLSYWTKWLEDDNPMIPKYENMLSGVNGWPKAWDNRNKEWWQWDYMYQGFIDYCGADMDFYGVHLYDWPSENKAQSTIRSGGHTEAMLDMFEWYDNLKFGAKKDIVISEFGSVATSYINSLPARRRDWEFLKPFNQMFMEFLERPSHVVMSMPFAPVKAVWGAYPKADGKVQRYDGATLFDPIGEWKGTQDPYVINEPTGGWDWSAIIYFFEIWKDVNGTRIDTKSNDLDVQVDAYVNNNHMYLILNNCLEENKTVSLNIFKPSNTITEVELRHLFFDANIGSEGEPTYTKDLLTSAPAYVTLQPNATIVLDYTFENNINIDQESKETKYMCEPLTSDTNDRGTQLCHTPSTASITATIKGVKKPIVGEAVVRIGGFFPNPNDGLTDKQAMRIKTLIVNEHKVIESGDKFEYNPRGVVKGGWKGSWFGVLELEVPIEYLVEGENTIVFERNQGVEFTTIMLQVWDMTQYPGRSSESAVALTSISLGSAESLKQGSTLVITPNYTPANATHKGLTWTSSNSNIATVDDHGVVTAVAASGSTVITATSISNPSIVATKTITTKTDHTSTQVFSESMANDRVSVYPNPAYNKLTVNGLNDATSMVIYNLQGVEIEHVEVSGNSVNVALDNYAKGTYVLRIIKKDSSELIKFIKK